MSDNIIVVMHDVLIFRSHLLKNLGERYQEVLQLPDGKEMKGKKGKKRSGRGTAGMGRGGEGRRQRDKSHSKMPTVFECIVPDFIFNLCCSV